MDNEDKEIREAKDDDLSSAWRPDDEIVLEWAGRAEGMSEEQ